MEQAFSGYCRTIDAARMVLCEAEAGEVDVGCDYGYCAYRDTCPVGKQIAGFLAEAEERP